MNDLRKRTLYSSPKLYIFLLRENNLGEQKRLVYKAQPFTPTTHRPLQNFNQSSNPHSWRPLKSSWHRWIFGSLNMFQIKLLIASLLDRRVSCCWPTLSNSDVDSVLQHCKHICKFFETPPAITNEPQKFLYAIFIFHVPCQYSLNCSCKAVRHYYTPETLSSNAPIQPPLHFKPGSNNSHFSHSNNSTPQFEQQWTCHCWDSTVFDVGYLGIIKDRGEREMWGRLIFSSSLAGGISLQTRRRSEGLQCSPCIPWASFISLREFSLCPECPSWSGWRCRATNMPGILSFNIWNESLTAMW